MLGLLREEAGLGARTLEGFGVDIDVFRMHVVRIVGRGEEAMSGQIPFTPRTKKILELSLREALSLGHNYIGTEHILLGLLRENEGVGSRILFERYDLDAEKIRNEVIRMLSGPGYARPQGEPPTQDRRADLMADIVLQTVADAIEALAKGATRLADELRDMA